MVECFLALDTLLSLGLRGSKGMYDDYKAETVDDANLMPGIVAKI
jgi:hypothetical protein